MISIVCPFLAGPKCLNIDTNSCVSAEDIKYAVSKRTAIPPELFAAFSGCHRIQSEEMVPDGSIVYLVFTLPGGKGGFGSMLRAIGAQIEKTTNREACRDLTGRRLRDINEEQRLKKWLEKKAEREIESAKRRKERLERLKQQPKHDFHDTEYNRQRSELPERIDDALTEGLQKAMPVVSKKRVADDDDDESEKVLKKHCLLLGVDLPSESESSDEESKSSEGGRCSDDTSQSAEYDNHQDAESDASCSTSANEGHQESIREGTTECKSKEPELNSECLKSSPDCSEAASMDKSTEEGADSKFNDGEFSGQSNTLPPVDENPCESQDIPLKEGHEPEEQHTHHGEAPTDDTEKSTDGELKTAADISKNDQSPLDTEDLLSFTSVSELESLGLDRLKVILMSLGLKCGGTLTERAQRLWSVRGLDPSDFPQALKAKTKKK